MSFSTAECCAGPLSTCSAPKEGAALLVILPGALLGPRDYHGLLRALQVPHMLSSILQALTIVTVLTTSKAASTTQRLISADFDC